MNSPLVSIIIPTLNNGHIIRETIDSIIEQTYTNWECIIVDDGSTDNTDAIIAPYLNNDNRIKFYNRPEAHFPGGNGARNFGFFISKGQYIQWFDSDDLMVPEKLELKVKSIKKHDVDFVISKTKYFNKIEENPNLYDYNETDVNFFSYATTHVSWYTPDMLIKRNVAEKVVFNEYLKFGQEFNFSCKLLLITHKMKKVDKFLTLRRDSENSIGNYRRENEESYLRTRFEIYWLNYLDITAIIKHKEFQKFSLLTCISCYLRSNDKIKLPKHFYKSLIEVFGFKTGLFMLAKWSKALFGNYYYFYKQLKA